jgi:excisionase family DNA binding protein
MPPVTKEPMLDATQIAGELNISQEISQEKSRQMLRRGEIPAIKVGRIWRARREDVEAIKRGRAPGEPVDQRVAAIIAAMAPLTDREIDDVVAIIRSDRGVA